MTLGGDSGQCGHQDFCLITSYTIKIDNIESGAIIA